MVFQVWFSLCYRSYISSALLKLSQSHDAPYLGNVFLIKEELISEKWLSNAWEGLYFRLKENTNSVVFCYTFLWGV